MLPGNILQRISDGYDKAWKVFIQPESMSYEMSALGPKIFIVEDVKLTREDFKVTNKFFYKIVCSVFLPHGFTENTPCIIYLHSQTGCRLEGLTIRDYCAQNNYALCVFDFSGCGNSEGEYVSLGWHEQDDLALVVDSLRDRYKFKRFSLWGRSMGAVTALLFAEKNRTQENVYISSMVLDSPFPELAVMVQDVAGRVLHLPKFVVNIGMSFLSSTIEKKIKYDLMELKPILSAKKLDIPVIFVVGKKDVLVRPERVNEMYSAYPGKKKKFIKSENDHGGERETFVYEECFKFVKENFEIEDYGANKKFNQMETGLGNKVGYLDPYYKNVIDEKYVKKYGNRNIDDIKRTKKKSRSRTKKSKYNSSRSPGRLRKQNRSNNKKEPSIGKNRLSGYSRERTVINNNNPLMMGLKKQRMGNESFAQGDQNYDPLDEFKVINSHLGQKNFNKQFEKTQIKKSQTLNNNTSHQMIAGGNRRFQKNSRQRGARKHSSRMNSFDNSMNRNTLNHLMDTTMDKQQGLQRDGTIFGNQSDKKAQDQLLRRSGNTNNSPKGNQLIQNFRDYEKKKSHKNQPGSYRPKTGLIGDQSNYNSLGYHQRWLEKNKAAGPTTKVIQKNTDSKAYNFEQSQANFSNTRMSESSKNKSKMKIFENTNEFEEFENNNSMQSTHKKPPTMIFNQNKANYHKDGFNNIRTRNNHFNQNKGGRVLRGSVMNGAAAFERAAAKPKTSLQRNFNINDKEKIRMKKGSKNAQANPPPNPGANNTQPIMFSTAKNRYIQAPTLKERTEANNGTYQGMGNQGFNDQSVMTFTTGSSNNRRDKNSFIFKRGGGNSKLTKNDLKKIVPRLDMEDRESGHLSHHAPSNEDIQRMKENQMNKKKKRTIFSGSKAARPSPHENYPHMHSPNSNHVAKKIGNFGPQSPNKGGHLRNLRRDNPLNIQPKFASKNIKSGYTRPNQRAKISNYDDDNDSYNYLDD